MTEWEKYLLDSFPTMRFPELAQPSVGELQRFTEAHGECVVTTNPYEVPIEASKPKDLPS